MIVLLVAGIGFLLAGLVSIGFGVPVKEFSFGNTLILSGVVGGCTGAILLGLHAVAREIHALAAVSGAGRRQPAPDRPVFPPPSRTPEADSGDELFPGDRDDAEPVAAGPARGPEGAPMPWQDEAAVRDRLRPRGLEPSAAPPPPAEPAPKKRNLLFSSSRKERERAAAAGETESSAETSPPPSPRSFDEAWPEPERTRGEPGARRSRPLFGGEPEREPEEAQRPAPPERPALPERSPPPRSEEMTEVSVLKSGVVDGMSYSLYSDGSIEAQMPEGMMRFASIDELRDHLDQRGA
jgi:hypothetical protein